MLTINPAKVLGIEHKKGVLHPNADADIILLNEALQLTKVFARGLSV
jgi:N-acetylglucosamine-6-phosphate deacetylase